MPLETPRGFTDALNAHDVRQILPTSLRSDLLSTIPAELRERAFFISGITQAEILDRVNSDIRDILSGQKTEQQVRAQLRQAVDLLKGTELDSDSRLKLVISTNVDMARGYGQWKQGQTALILDQFPAYEFYRAEKRKEPRDWPARWAAAGGKFFPGESDYPQGRMIALKNDPIWDEISAFGVPYPPFDYNSGMDLEDIDRDEAIELGLISEKTKAQKPKTRGFNEDLKSSPDIRSGALSSALSSALQGIAELIDGGIWEPVDRN